MAASRRSDRSLEARVESARRASEIHKRRTGRSLRVTEQDVINEEMYEEEDDDMPMQYRRLTAHLQTGSPDFNNRLSAYLTSNVAMRSGLEDAIQRSYALSTRNYQAPPTAYSSPLMSMPMHPQQYMGSYIDPSAALPSNPTRPIHVGHGRSASIAVPTTASHSTPLTTPPHAGATPTMQQKSKSVSPPRSDARASQSVSGVKKEPSPQHRTSDSPVPTLVASPGATPSSRTSSLSIPPQTQQLPLSTSLPIEAQQLLAQSGGMNDPMFRSMMSHPQYYAPQQYSTSMSLSKQQNFHPNVSGMSATLAPSALDMKHTYNTHTCNNQNNYPASATAVSRPSMDIKPHFNGLQGPFSAPPTQLSFDTSFPDLDVAMFGGHGGSRQVSPGEQEVTQEQWDRFLQPEYFDTLPVADSD